MGEKLDYLIIIKPFCKKSDQKVIHVIRVELVVTIHSYRFVYKQAVRSGGCPH